MTDRRCENCRFCFVVPTVVREVRSRHNSDGMNIEFTPGRLECRINPPQCSENTYSSGGAPWGVWPAVSVDSWCGEWQPKAHSDPPMSGQPDGVGFRV